MNADKTSVSQTNEPDFAYGGEYSYADYLKWTIEERLELIKGKVFRMSPAPNHIHQRLVSDLHGHLWSFLRNKACQAFVAPFDVRLPRKSKRDEDVITVVQPDICVVCDPAKLDKRGCIGAPDVVIEVLSPSNNRKELKNKYEVYEESGVNEYWIVSPQDHSFLVYTLVDGKYMPSKLMGEDDLMKSTVLDGFALNLEELFGNIPKELEE